MPYVDKETRSELLTRTPETPGELNYCITTLILAYLAGRPVGYDTINSVVGVLECAKLELYRRLAAPYEDAKIAANGDVY